MREDNRVSFYTDRSKHHEFLVRLQEILDDPQSNIANCYIARSTSDRFCVFFETKNPRYSFSNIVFDFCNPFSRETDDQFLADGLSQFDVDNLKPFLDGFAFKNSYEGLFFSSVFVGPEFNPKQASSIYFKFTPDVDKKQHLVDGKKCELKEAVTSRENLVYELERQHNKKHANLFKCSTYSFQESSKREHSVASLKKIGAIVPRRESFLVEFYYDVEYLDSYIKSVHMLINDELVEVDIQDFITESNTNQTV